MAMRSMCLGSMFSSSTSMARSISLLRQSVGPATGTAAAARPFTILSKQSGEEYKKMNYSQRMKETGRPVSPHVTIYAFPMAALSSITNRVTGVALSMGCAGLATIEIVGGSGTSLYVLQTIGDSSFLLSATAKFAVSFPIAFHYMGAIRHLAWDQKPDMLTNVDVEKSSYYLFGGATAVALASSLFL